MRASVRTRGRFVAASGLRRIPGLPDGPYELLIVDAAGAPVTPLIEWYRLREVPGPNRTRRTYLGMLLPFFAFLQQQGCAWNASPELLRRCIRQFLQKTIACLVPYDDNYDGYRVETTGDSPLSKSGLGVCLAALRDFYTVMEEANYYPYPNPMRSELLIKWRREWLRNIDYQRLVAWAERRREFWQESRRHPTAYFRQKGRQLWKPRLGLELRSVVIQQQMLATIDFMISSTKWQRDRIVLLLLRQTGARLHEILGLTAGGYRRGQELPKADPDQCQAYVVNKGSQGREEKLIYFTPSVEQALLRYIRTERRTHDLAGRRRLEDLDERDPLFLTRKGKPYSSEAFRYHWRQITKRAKLLHYLVGFTPHTLRHLFVTQNMMNFKAEAAKRGTNLQDLKEGFQDLMAWRSQETMLGYDQSDKDGEALQAVGKWQRDMEEQDFPRIGFQPEGEEKPSARLTAALLPGEEAWTEQEDLRFWEEESEL